MKKQQGIYVLGIHDGHNAGAAITKNGDVVAAISEERLTLVKNQSGPPMLSIAKVFDIAGITPQDISLVAFASKYRIVNDVDTETQSMIFKMHMATAPYLHGKLFTKLAVQILHKVSKRTDVFDALKKIGLGSTPVRYVEHHHAHAASAYYSRPWKDKTLIFTLDGMGDGVSATVNIGDGSTIKRVAESSNYDTLGANVYTEITRYLGMRRNEHEYKVMGLAPYGDPSKTIDVFRKVMRFNPKNPLVFENISGMYMETLEPFYQRELKYKRFDHIASGVQKFFEEMVTTWVGEAIKQTGIHKICAAGGSFLNVKTNMLLRRMPEVHDLFVYPASDDGGLAAGAALAEYIQYCKEHQQNPEITPMTTAYYGQEFTDAQIQEFVKQKKLKAKKSTPEDVGALLAQGKIIARFAGRDEWGPRALGNRSIMADPRHFEVVQRLNSAIKMRDFWMPFAPAILEEDQHRYMKHPVFSPYMIEAFETTPEAKDITATVHPADKTTRTMTVNDWNKPWQDIIRAFKKRTGVGGILNTSFNLHGYPLVGTPEQALWTYENSGLDGLLLGGYLLQK